MIFNLNKHKLLTNKQIDDIYIKIETIILFLASAQGAVLINGAKMLSEGIFRLKFNPYNGNSIIISDNMQDLLVLKSATDLKDNDESFLDIIKHIRNNLSGDDRKNYLLLSALSMNDEFNDEEKKELANIINYINDDPYINYEYVYGKIIGVHVDRDQPMDVGISASYYRSLNRISVGVEQEKSISHEFFHTVSNYDSSEQGNRWFEEGMTSILDYEYFNKDISYQVISIFIRILCEFVGPNVLLKTRNANDINILIDALVSQGLDKEQVLELFDVVNEYLTLSLNFDIDLNEKSIKQNNLKAQIIKDVWDFYNTMYDNFYYVNPLIHQYILQIKDGKPVGDIYYFNSMKKLKQPTLIIRKEIYAAYLNDELVKGTFEIVMQYDNTSCKKIIYDNGIILSSVEQFDSEYLLNCEVKDIIDILTSEDNGYSKEPKRK